MLGRVGCAAIAAATLIAAGATDAAAQGSPLDRVAVHGYVTQAAAASSDLPIMGITPTGTLDYRTAAIQFGIMASQSDRFVLQVNHHRMSDSPIAEEMDALGLHWLYYERRLGPARVRVGRVPMAFGLSNELRSVGTVLPFYQAPAQYYLAGFETLDGGVVVFDAAIGSWGITVDGMGGATKLQTLTGEDGLVSMQTREKGLLLGSELWLAPPIAGLRVGIGGTSWGNDEANHLEEDHTFEFAWHGSVEYAADRFAMRAEYQRLNVDELQLTKYYGGGDLRLVDRLWLHAQAEVSESAGEAENAADALEWRDAEDLALGLRFAHKPNLVYKLEAHRARGTCFDVFVDPTGPLGSTTYVIGSMSFSF